MPELDIAMFVRDTCEEIAANGVDILARFTYSSLQMEDMGKNLEAITDGRMQMRQEEVPQRD